MLSEENLVTRNKGQSSCRTGNRHPSSITVQTPTSVMRPTNNNKSWSREYLKKDPEVMDMMKLGEKNEQ